MPADAAQPPPSLSPPRLRVRILVRDPMRRLGLQKVVTDAGHRIANAADDGDITLTDADSNTEPDDATPVLALGAAEAGQAGLLPRNATPAQIAAALQAVGAGLIVRAGEAPRRTFGAATEANAPLLSPREVEILTLIGDGLSNKEVARRLGISGHTVKFHIESLFRKLAAGSRAEAVHRGLRQGLIEL
jgi:two-component system, NarL family, nitrate/nitrite response regulator NarL